MKNKTYDEDFCANCGQIRLENSTLCADCLIACNVRLHAEKNQIKQRVGKCIEEHICTERHLVEENSRLKQKASVQQKLLRHCFAEFQELKRVKAADIIK